MGRKQQRSKHNYASVEGILSIYCDNNIYTFTQTVYFATDIAFSYMGITRITHSFFCMTMCACIQSTYIVL